MDDEINRQKAAEFMEGEVWSAATWLENFRDGKNKRGAMDIEQHEKKLKYRMWILKKLKGE